MNPTRNLTQSTGKDVSQGPYNNICAVILAGGRSRRMGRAKPFLKVNGRRMIDISLAVLNSLFTQVLIVADNKAQFTSFTNVKVVEDLIRGCGPLGGVYTGLRSISTQSAFFLACDMPLIGSKLIKRLVDFALNSDYDCVIPNTANGAQPLHTIYAKSALPTIEKLLRGQDFSLRQLFSRCKCKFIKVGSHQAATFFNVNTPLELKRVQRQFPDLLVC